MRHLLAAAGLVVIVVLAGAAPAMAHAELTSTAPAASMAVAEPPREVLLRFTESVEAGLGAIRVLDGGGRPIEVGEAFHPGDEESEVAVGLPALSRGSYLVTWRVISGDSHPVTGAFTFRVGPPEAGGVTPLTTAGAAAGPDGSRTVGILFAFSRFGVFASLVVLVGGAAFVLALWPDGSGDARVRRLLSTAWVVAVVCTGAGIGLQGAYAAAPPLTAAVRPGVIPTVLDTRFGQMSVLRLVLLALVVPLSRLLRAGASRDPRSVPAPVSVPALLLGTAVLMTLGLAGHAGSGDQVPVAVVSDLLHLMGVSTWLGGLGVLALCALPRGDGDELARVVPRFSTVAFSSVVVIVVTGTFQSWRQVGSLDALTDTSYGRLLLVKLALFAGLLALGGASRAWVRRRYRAPALAMSAGPGASLAEAPAVKLARLRRSVGAEVVIAVAVLGVTSLLVNAAPARSSLVKPYSTSIEAKGLRIDLDVDPAEVGPTDIHVHTLTLAGVISDVESVEALLSLEAQAIGPLKATLHRMAPGRFIAHAFDVPIAGTWKIELIVLRNQVDQVRGVATVPIR